MNVTRGCMLVRRNYECVDRGVNLSCIRTKSLLVAISIGLLLLAAGSSVAQNSLGAISGGVTDASGLAVPDATVTVLRPDAGISIKTTTNKNGAYYVTSLVPGQYQIVIEKSGYRRLEVDAITVNPAGNATVDSQLKVGNVSEAIDVSANSEMLSTQSSAVVTNIGQELSGNLPYPEQGTLEAALLAPGVHGSQNAPSGIVSENPGIYTGNVEPGAQIEINGATAGHTALLVDGSDVTQTSYSRAAITVSAGMVGQVTVISGAVPAQYGRTEGGIVISATRSGTNQYHGSIRWRHTDPFFQAQPDGQAVGPALHQNFFGFFLGGPIRIPHVYNGTDKTFFYAGFEPARLSNKTTALAQIPIPADLQGNYHDDINLINQTIFKSSGEAAALAAPRTGATWYQSPINSAGFPVGAQYSKNVLYQQIPNDNLTSQLAQNAFASYVFSQFPTPANPLNVIFLEPDGYYNPSNLDNVNAIRGVLNNDNRYSFRVDQVFSNIDRMYGRYSHTPVVGQRFGLFAVSSPLTPWQTDTSDASNAIIDETHVFSSSLINEAKVSYLRNNQNRQEPTQSLGKDWAASLGLTPATSGKGFPSVSGLGYNLGTSTIADVIDAVFQVQDNVTMIRGNHTLAMGGDYRRMQSNEYSNPGLTGGSYSFTANDTNGCTLATYSPTAASCSSGGGSAAASLALGLIGSFSNQSAKIPGYYRWHYFATYVQDDWRILPKLTLNLGMRYAIETPRSEINGNQGWFVPSASGSLNGIAATGAFCFVGACGLPKTMWPVNYHGFQPRLGVAWNPIPKLTVRSSFSIFRVPLTGLNNTSSPNLGVSNASTSGTTGGVVPNEPVDYITNPVQGPFISAISGFAGSKGPFFTVPSGFPISYVSQLNAVPYSQQWTLTLQYQILRSAIVEVGYVGSQGVHLFNNNSVPQNFPNLNTYFADIASGDNFSATTPTAANPTPANVYGICATQTPGCTPVNETLAQKLLPYQNFFNQTSAASGADAQIGELNNRTGVSSYNSMYIAGTQRFDRGLTLQASFTWSKSIDDEGGDLAAQQSLGFTSHIQNPLNPAGEKSVSDYDVPARIIVGSVYLLPYGNQQNHKLTTSSRNAGLNFADRVINGVFGDWGTGGIFRAESGQPFLPTLGTSPENGGAPGFWFSTGSSSTASIPTGVQPRPDVNPGIPCINPYWHISAYNKFNEPYINAGQSVDNADGALTQLPEPFSVPGALGAPAFGDARRTMPNCRSPRQINFDANVTKRIPMGGEGKRYLEIEIQGFNVLNHPLFYIDGGANSSPNDGRIFTSYASTNASPPGVTPGFLPSPTLATVNNTFTAQFSRYVQIGAAFYF